ncbi:hypothetical protein EWM64_g2196 [Hericium alpestre]|uniref:BCD1 alpha/beta domain-containing protein n=1 Tax=Hericium alpestre TaxID=135208 RepID=A0A4Z0A7A4_9AGAM|nr:hypothetical protein EWM64_g2196 [Hericium alpestre]
MQLELRDIDVDFLPAGMERRAHNQSTWDFKYVLHAFLCLPSLIRLCLSRNQTALLTIEFKFHMPPDAHNPNHTQDPPYTLLTHRNNFDTPLLALLQSHLRERGKTRRDGATPPWVKALVLPDQDVPDSFTPPQFFMPATVDTLTLPPGTKAVYHRLDGDVKLSTLLKHKHFVEFPTVEVWEEGAFRGSLVDAQGGIRPEVYERPVKRRRLTTAAGKKAISGLLGAYGSDEEEDERPVELLGDYAESDTEIGQQETGETGEAGDMSEGEEVALEDAGDESEGEGEGELGPVEYALLTDLMQTKQGQGMEEGDDPEVDWGESDGGEGVV